MSYAVIRMKKFKATDVKGMQIHDYREKESQTNFDIDPDRTKLNYDVLNQGKLDFKKRIDEEIEKRYKGQRAVRKDAVRLCEFVITSDKEFFDGLSPEEEKQFFKESVQFLQDRYGKDNILYGIVHKDEKTPHMHLGMVPITKDGKLAAKQFFGNKKELQSLQTSFHKHVQENGFDLERGEKGSDRKHVEAQKYKAQTLKEEINTLESDLKAIQEVDRTLRDITSENKTKADMRSKIGLKGKTTIEIPQENYEQLYAMASRSYDHAKNEKEYREKHARAKELLEKSETKNQRLEKQLDTAEKENTVLKKENKLLHKTIDVLKSKFKERSKEFSQTVGHAKAKAINLLKMSKYPKSLFNERDQNEQAGKDRFIQEVKKQRIQQKGKGLSR